MRILPLVAFLILHLHAAAQCCCADHNVEVHADGPMHSGSTWHYRADLDHARELHWRMDSVRGNPNALRLSMPTGCGIDKARWVLTNARTGEMMVIDLYHLPGDSPLPDIKLPFAGNRIFHFDMRDILACVPAGSKGGKYWTQELICNTGRVRHTYDEGRLLRFEPLELEAWTKEPAPPRHYTAPQEALYLDGPAGMQHYLFHEVGKPLIATLPGTMTFTGHAMVEANGTVNEITLDRTPYPDLEEAIRNALLRSGRWQPAVVERPSFPEGPRNFQAIRHTVPVRFEPDPTTVWGTIGDLELSVLPSEPTSKDSIHLEFQWYAGSCGVYRDTVVIDPPTPLRPWTDIAVGIGGIGSDCEDIVINRRTIVLPPQPPGDYRVRFGEAPAGTWAIRRSDPYVFREVVVH